MLLLLDGFTKLEADSQRKMVAFAERQTCSLERFYGKERVKVGQIWRAAGRIIDNLRRLLQEIGIGR